MVVTSHSFSSSFSFFLLDVRCLHIQLKWQQTVYSKWIAGFGKCGTHKLHLRLWEYFAAFPSPHTKRKRTRCRGRWNILWSGTWLLKITTYTIYSKSFYFVCLSSIDHQYIDRHWNWISNENSNKLFIIIIIWIHKFNSYVQILHFC